MASYRLSQVAELVGGTVKGNPDREIDSLRPLDTAGPRDLSFLTNSRYRRQAAASGAGALLVDPGSTEIDKDLVIVEDPYFSLATLLGIFEQKTEPDPGIHPTAIIEDGADVAASASVGGLFGDRPRQPDWRRRYSPFPCRHRQAAVRLGGMRFSIHGWYSTTTAK